MEKGLQEGVFSCKGLGRLCVNCQHQERKKTRNALYLAGDNEMSQGVTRGRKAGSLDSAALECRRNPEPRVLWKIVFQACSGAGGQLVTWATSRRSKPWGASAGVVVGHCALASWPLHKPSLTGWHLWQAAVQKGTHAAIFQPGHQDLNGSACVSEAEVSLKLICGRLNLWHQRTTGSIN